MGLHGTVSPTASEYVPPGQGVGDDNPFEEQVVPGGQGIHTFLFVALGVGLDVPTGQGVGVVAPVSASGAQ